MGSSKELGISTSARKFSNNDFDFSHAAMAFFASPCFPAASMASKVGDNFLNDLTAGVLSARTIYTRKKEVLCNNLEGDI